MKSRSVWKVFLVSLAATIILLGVHVAPSSAGGGKEGGVGASESHLAGPAIFGTITLTDENHDLVASLDFVGKCMGNPVEYHVSSWFLFDPINTLTEKCTLCDGTEFNFFEKSFWQDLGGSPSLVAAGCSTSQDLVLETVTKFLEIDLNSDNTTDKIVVQGIFLFDVLR